MRARVVGFARGAAWLVEGWRIFRAAPFGWIALVFGYLFLTQLLAVVPVIGAAAGAVLVPPFTVGLMGAARAVSRGARLELAMLFEGFRNALAAQLALGVVYLGCLVLVFGGMTLADQEGALRAVLSGERPEELERGELLFPAAVLVLLYAPVFMMFWFAPPLAAWHGTGVAKSLFFSLAACLMNWRAFVAYGALAAAVIVAVPLAVRYAFRLGGGDPGPGALGLALALLLGLLPAVIASFYASYRDVFGAGSEAVSSRG